MRQLTAVCRRGVRRYFVVDVAMCAVAEVVRPQGVDGTEELPADQFISERNVGTVSPIPASASSPRRSANARTFALRR